MRILHDKCSNAADLIHHIVRAPEDGFYSPPMLLAKLLGYWRLQLPSSKRFRQFFTVTSTRQLRLPFFFTFGSPIYLRGTPMCFVQFRHVTRHTRLAHSYALLPSCDRLATITTILATVSRSQLSLVLCFAHVSSKRVGGLKGSLPGLSRLVNRLPQQNSRCDGRYAPPIVVLCPTIISPSSDSKLIWSFSASQNTDASCPSIRAAHGIVSAAMRFVPSVHSDCAIRSDIRIKLSSDRKPKIFCRMRTACAGLMIFSA